MTPRIATPRVAARPDPAAWGENELLSLAEATALFWPDGPITERTLRTAVRDGRLPISLVARKFFVTKTAIASLSRCEPLATGRRPATGPTRPVVRKRFRRDPEHRRP
jgi:hypothetical protein